MCTEQARKYFEQQVKYVLGDLQFLFEELDDLDYKDKVEILKDCLEDIYEMYLCHPDKVGKCASSTKGVDSQST